MTTPRKIEQSWYYGGFVKAPYRFDSFSEGQEFFIEKFHLLDHGSVLLDCVRGGTPSSFVVDQSLFNLLIPNFTKDNFKYFWKIFVPVNNNEGIKFSLTYHQEWDKKVRSITGGLTVFKTSKGQFVMGDVVFHDRMIPVEIYCTESQIDQIIQITMEYYHQEAILCTRVSDLIKLVKKSK
jgi:hypothetical protein